MIQDRIPPNSIEAETATLGSLLLDPHTIDIASEIVGPEAFYREAHRRIYEAILDLHGRNEPVDLLTVEEVLSRRDQLSLVGGPVYLFNLTSEPSSSANIAYYAGIVRERHLLREMVRFSAELSDVAYSPGERTASEIIDQAETLLREIGAVRTDDRSRTLREILEEQLEALESRYERKGPAGRGTPFSDYDYYTQGLHSGELTVLAGRPGQGKTSGMLQIALHHAGRHGPALIFSLEMSAGQLADRLIASESRVDFGRIRTGYLGTGEWQRIGDTILEMREAPLTIDDTPALTIQEMRAKARRLHDRRALSLVCVDYLQLISGSGGRMNRTTEVGEVSRGLKALARDLNVPVIALAQLSRAVEQRPDKRPIMSDLRESGSIEADADVVTFVFRPDYYKREDDRDPYAETEPAEWIIAKQRNGPTGTAKLAWRGACTRFEEITTRYEDPRIPYAD